MVFKSCGTAHFKQVNANSVFDKRTISAPINASMYLITGMHRSGTSLIARFFFEAGADFGDPATFHPADRWNPDGYFEQTDIHAINMPLINGPWGKLSYFRLPSTETIVARSRRLAEQIRRTGEKYENKVVKENRFCLTLPAWRQYATRFKQVIICLRDPADVVRSIQRRNRITQGIGYRLWLTHLERLLLHTADLPVLFVRYENVLDRQQVGRELSGPLSSAGVSSGDDQLRGLHTKLVRAGSVRPDRPPSTALPTAVARLWDDLIQRHASQPCIH